MATSPPRAIDAVHHVTRAERRRPALWTTKAEHEGAHDLKLVLRNVSRSGFMASVSAPVPAGSRVRLRLPFGGSVEAIVRWSFNGQLGCRLVGRFSRTHLAFLMFCGALNGLFSLAALRNACMVAGVALIILA